MDIEFILRSNKASKIKRLVNVVIDIIVFYILVFAIGAIVALILLEINPSSTFFYELENVDPLVDRIVTMLLYAFVMFLTEWLLNGRSIGKYITGTIVLDEDGNKPTADAFLKRNFARAVPFDNFSFLGQGRGWHDQWSDTYVVNKAAFENAKQEEVLLNEISMNDENRFDR